MAVKKGEASKRKLFLCQKSFLRKKGFQSTKRSEFVANESLTQAAFQK
ncbi:MULTISPECIES: hypothetical protein [Aeribacillus]|nr:MULTISPECIES: hypothetical protein [Aeribacillus]MED0652297.1 hypothetical protein [Aeribacillus composti]MED0714281.1 hypothetical protein [Aeribacillus composti]MED0747314.1 hypothetical protein [Aeribacillus composti]MED4488762.1 hypothetical protein [Aeribacillus pallidus]